MNKQLIKLLMSFFKKGKSVAPKRNVRQAGRKPRQPPAQQRAEAKTTYDAVKEELTSLEKGLRKMENTAKGLQGRAKKNRLKQVASQKALMRAKQREVAAAHSRIDELGREPLKEVVRPLSKRFR